MSEPRACTACGHASDHSTGTCQWFDMRPTGRGDDSFYQDDCDCPGDGVSIDERYGVTDPCGYPELPIDKRLMLAANPDMGPDDMYGWGDDEFGEIRSLLAHHGWHVAVQMAHAMGLVGDWGTDDVEEALWDALRDHAALRARVAELEAAPPIEVLLSSLDETIAVREATPGRPEDGPYPGTIEDCAVEIVDWIGRAEAYAPHLTELVASLLTEQSTPADETGATT